MHEDRRRAVLTGLHEVVSCLAVRQRQFVRITRSRRLSWLCRSHGWCRLRLCDEPDGDAVDRRPAGGGAERCTLLRYSDFVRLVAGCDLGAVSFAPRGGAICWWSWGSVLLPLRSRREDIISTV